MPSIEISETAFEYLRKHAVPLSDTSVTVLDRLLTEHERLTRVSSANSRELEMRFSGKNLPSVKFTSIQSAKINSLPVKKRSWNHILEDVISASVSQGATGAEVRHILQANTKDGEHAENGYRFVPSAGFSFQGLEANRVCKNLALLSERYDVKIDIEVRWEEDERAAFPMQTAQIVMP